MLTIANSAGPSDATAPAASSAPAATTQTPVAPSGPDTPAVPSTEPATEVSPDAVVLSIAALAAELASTPVVIRTYVGELTLTVDDLGIALEPDATFEAVRELRTAGAEIGLSATQAWVGWSTDPQFSERRYRVDRSAARAALSDAADIGVTATPPTIVVVNDTLAVDLGLPGQVVDTDAIVDRVLESVTLAVPRIEIAAELIPGEPFVNTPELQQAVNAAHSRYGHELVLAYGTSTHDLTMNTIAGWLQLDTTATPPTISLDQAQVGSYVEEAFAAASAPSTTAAMAVVNGTPTVVAGDGSVACCADEVAAVIEEALRARVAGPLTLPPRPAVSRQEQALLESLGIAEVVGRYTTKHACCQGRVKNIHRFADLMRGAIVEPGQSLSLNDHVGRRTAQRGFVEGGFIHHGVLVDDIGGGVSQFATTIFNALIRAGMTIDEYQTHSLYLSRYPYGLDPTISYPEPDLKFTNPTPYGLLIWPTYTDTSITVELYSTRNVAVTIGEPTEVMQEFCRRVSTDRTRVFSDGTVETDTFRARYRPEPGRNCDGTRSVPRQCVDPLLSPAKPVADGQSPQNTPDSGDSERAMVDDGTTRADGSVVECPPLECVEQPGERTSASPRYPDDPCLGVDLSTLGADGGDDRTGDGTGSDDTNDDGTDKTDDSGDGATNGDDTNDGSDGATDDSGDDGDDTNDGSDGEDS